MASDLTDLIRAVDERHHLVQRAAFPGGDVKAMCDRCVVPWPCEVRRLRDALRAERKDSTLFENLYDEAQAELAERFANKDRDRAALVELIAARAEYDEARAALAEANATIERALELAAYLESKSGTTDAAIRRSVATEFRRAIEGPAT